LNFIPLIDYTFELTFELIIQNFNSLVKAHPPRFFGYPFDSLVIHQSQPPPVFP